MRIFFPERKVMKMKVLANELIQQHKQVSGRLVARLLGKLGSLRVACPEVITLSRGLMRSLQELLMRSSDRESELRDMRFVWRDYNGYVSLSPLAVAEVRFWLAHVW